MKKVIINSVVLVAFSFVGLANEIKNDKVIVKAKLVVNDPTEFDKGYCTATADIAEQNSSSKKWTYKQWKKVYDECIESRVKAAKIEKETKIQ